jgi:hypothetical protein
LSDTKSLNPALRGKEAWKSVEALGLRGEEASDWNNYVILLQSNFISIDEDNPNSLY